MQILTEGWEIDAKGWNHDGHHLENPRPVRYTSPERNLGIDTSPAVTNFHIENENKSEARKSVMKPLCA